MVGFRGGRSGGLAAVLGRDFSGKIIILQIHFCVLGDCLESPGAAFGEVLARPGAISVRSGPHFGANPSKFTLWWDVEGAVQAVCRRFWDSIFRKTHDFCKFIFASLGCPRST